MNILALGVNTLIIEFNCNTREYMLVNLLRIRRKNIFVFLSCTSTKRVALLCCTTLQKKWMPMMISGLVVEDVDYGNSGLE